MFLLNRVQSYNNFCIYANKSAFFCKNAALTDLFIGARVHEKYIYTMYIYRKGRQKMADLGLKSGLIAA